MRFLDYQKVKQAEREKAEELFGTAEEPTELASKVWQQNRRPRLPPPGLPPPFARFCVWHSSC